jgi:hypothetical protein
VAHCLAPPCGWCVFRRCLGERLSRVNGAWEGCGSRAGEKSNAPHPGDAGVFDCLRQPGTIRQPRARSGDVRPIIVARAARVGPRRHTPSVSRAVVVPAPHMCDETTTIRVYSGVCRVSPTGPALLSPPFPAQTYPRHSAERHRSHPGGARQCATNPARDAAPSKNGATASSRVSRPRTAGSARRRRLRGGPSRSRSARVRRGPLRSRARPPARRGRGPTAAAPRARRRA